MLVGHLDGTTTALSSSPPPVRPARADPKRLWWESNHGPFLLRPREDLVEELESLADRLVSAYESLVRGEAPAPEAGAYRLETATDSLEIPRVDLAWLLTPARSDLMAFADESIRLEISDYRPRMADTAIAVAIVVAGASGAGSAADVVTQVKDEVDARWDATDLQRLVALEREFGGPSWQGGQLEGDRCADLRGWRFGGPSAWLALAAHVEVEIRYGPRHRALDGDAGRPSKLHDLKDKELRAAMGLMRLSEVSIPIWRRAGAEIGKWFCAGSEAPDSAVRPPTPAAEEPEFLSVNETAGRLGVNRKTLYEAFRHGSVPGVARVGGRILVDWGAFRAAIARGDVRPT